MPKAARILLRSVAFVAFVLITSAIGFEICIRAVRYVNAGVRQLLYIPRIAPDYEEAKSLEELLDRTIIGFSPYSNFAGFILNSRGFVTPEYAEKKADGVYRVVALGDSFTQKAGGIDFKRQWTTLLEGMLSTAIGGKVEVVNLGVCAVGPRFEKRVWELEGRRLAPDVVMLGLFVGNDFTDEAGSTLAGIQPKGGESPTTEWWLRNSLAFRLVRNWWLLSHGNLESAGEQKQHLAPPPPPTDNAGRPRGGYEVDSYPPMFDDQKPTFEPATYASMEGWLMSLYLKQNRAGFDRTFANVTSILADLDRDVRAHGSRFVVVVIPDEFQVDPAVRAEVMAAAKTKLEDYDLDLPQRELAAFFARAGIASLDLLETFREQAKNGRLYRPRDTHWNVAGNRLAAERIAQYLAAHR